jgi:hypothetical protein
VLACSALAVPVGACGGGGSDEDDVKKAVNGVYDALASKNPEKVCDSLSKEGKEQIVRTTGRSGKRMSCTSVFELGFTFAGDAFKDARDAEVTDVQVDGDEATATVKFKGKTGDVSLVKEDGDWKLDDLQTAGR